MTSSRVQSSVDLVFTVLNLICKSKEGTAFYISCAHGKSSYGALEVVRPRLILGLSSVLVSNAVTFEFMKKTPFF